MTTVTTTSSGSHGGPDAASTVWPAGFPPPTSLESPATAPQVAEILASNPESVPVYPFGAGHYLGEGALPTEPGIGVSTSRLDRVLEYDPGDLVVSVESGVTLGHLQEVLGEHGQWLPFEAPGGDDATIGGLLASAQVGPRQLGSSSLRDLLLGMTVAQTDGTVARSGGMVVKNVTGFDMGRLHVGANGTLGVICSANFRVLPRPETEASVISNLVTTADILPAVFELYESSRSVASRPVAMDAQIAPETTTVMARFEGRAGAVLRQVQALARRWPGARIVPAEESRRMWQGYLAALDVRGDDRLALRITSRPRDLADLTRSLVARLIDGDGGSWHLRVSPGLGIARLMIDQPDAAQSRLVRDAVAASEGNAVVCAAPVAFRDSLPPRESEHRQIDRALRSAFDPAGVLNRGRFPL